MEKKKLTLEKFKISKLNNLHMIVGGNGDDDGTGSDRKPQCKKKSAIIKK